MTGVFTRLARSIAAYPDKPYLRVPHGLIFGRSFNQATARRLLILYRPAGISYASVYPFLHYADVLAAQYDVQVRLFPIEKALANGVPKGLTDATHVIGQTWLTEPQDRHDALARVFDGFPADTVTAYLDSFANADIRHAGRFPNIDFYFKKSLFVDLAQFTRTTYGHTNLTEFYGRLYDLPDEMTDWKVPESVLPKLRLAPNFLSSPSLTAAFVEADALPPFNAKDIDIHARLGGTKAVGWYGEMRRQAQSKIANIDGPNVIVGTGVSKQVFFDEMLRSKLCFSPFGYGELCWRDIEAMACGAVVVKPDMSHLRTEPDLFRDGETYIACRWDFADLEDKVRGILADDEKREHIAVTAWSIARDYLRSAGPVKAYSALFE
ncbi:MAG: glycosyltransferase [Pseudomonadota bacterium]